MKIKIFALLALCFLSVPSQSDNQIKQAPPKQDETASEVRPIMQQILIHIQALRPFMTSELKFVDKKNSEIIREHLQGIAVLIRKAKHTDKLKSPTLSISRNVLEDHIIETERIFRVGDKRYARWALNSTLSICMSCHTQTAEGNTHPWQLTGFGEYGSSFDQAELMFTGRDYKAAISLYDRVIDEFPDNALKVEEVETALARKVAYFSRIHRDFTAAIESMQHSQKNKKLPQSALENLVAWEGLFRKQSKIILPDPKTSNDEQIKKFVDGELKKGLWDSLIEANNPRLVTNLTVSGILYEYLQAHPGTKMKPEILYWLAQCDRKINNNFFYSLADIYLKECMLSFSSEPIAKKCFKEYETHMIASYSGSSGVNVPDDVLKELKMLRMKVEKGQR